MLYPQEIRFGLAGNACASALHLYRVITLTLYLYLTEALRMHSAAHTILGYPVLDFVTTLAGQVGCNSLCQNLRSQAVLAQTLA